MTDDPEAPPTPEETLRLIERQQAATVRQLKGEPLLLYLPWGVAWLIGFGAVFLHFGLDGRGLAPISQMQAVGVLQGAQVLAGAFAGFGIARRSRLVRGDASARGAMTGYSWAAGMALMIVICVRLSVALPEEEAQILWTGASLLVVGLMYMMSSAAWLEWPMFFLGAWTIAVDATGVMLGAGWQALLVAVLVGGGFIAASLWLRRRP
ncbi:hypothetical protein [Nonomuraea roseoviolacea]|uniref:Transporter n=1 Tax=Nonomuraea roseoviolacea subsp. carminata TaxID=160689 RepID=A0ABT1KFI5_9ACTN|nr:hypothetical protein [Nonomuraea roseoviolacea]MCP2352736.1 hypothetical protein [Nonomuraea roseoviolacea subsp. carminata]